MSDSPASVDVVVIGGGQAALALGFYLRRTSLSYVILDEQPAPGGSWRRSWKSLRAFSPAQWSSLPGWLMPRVSSSDTSEYPTRDEVVSYLSEYEKRYSLPVEHGVYVTRVERDGDRFRVKTKRDAEWSARAVINATGGRPLMPPIEGQRLFKGMQLHSIEYSSPSPFVGKRVVVVGGGNSGAQIVADLTESDSRVGKVTWATLEPPTFLPDEIDGRYLFEQATAIYEARKAGRTPETPRSLGDVVMVAPVKAARERGALQPVRMFVRMTESGVVWPDGSTSDEDAVIWATGYVPALAHLAPLRIVNDKGRIDVDGTSGTRSSVEPRMWVVGYGNWTGYASATLIGVGRSAKATVEEVEAALTQA